VVGDVNEIPRPAVFSKELFSDKEKKMNTKRILFISFIIMAEALAACGTAATPVAEPTTAPPPAPTATPVPADPAAIVQSYYRAYNAGDLEALMALVAEDVKCRGGCYLTGKDRFRFLIQGDITTGTQYEISDLKVEGDKVTYTVGVYSNAGFLQFSGVETMQIKDGLIILIEAAAPN